jgi:hypothetical protein
MVVRNATVAEGLPPIAIKCPKCGEKTEKAITWLVNEHVLPCRKCGHGIDLKSGHARYRIKEIARSAGEMDIALAQASNLKKQ